MAFNVSTPIAFDAAATTDAASCAAAPVASRVSNSMAVGTVVSRIAFLRIDVRSERVPPTARALYLSPVQHLPLAAARQGSRASAVLHQPRAGGLTSAPDNANASS